MSWFFFVVIFAWVVPIILRRMSQDPRRRTPPRDRGYNRYGGYPGNPYPRGFPPPPPAKEQTGQNQGQQIPPPAGGGWWQQPIPPGTFPGQQEPVPQKRAGQASPQAAPSPVPPPVPTSEPQGYRARKLAELDQQFTDQKISLEEYMKARNEVMRG
jgi:hypothetical protein